MEILDTGIFLKQFKELEESPLEVIPNGMKKEDFELMWQVLTAKKPSELEHISNEQLIHMFYCVDDVAEITSNRETCFHCSDSDNSPYGFLGAIKNLPSASHCRRVL